MPLSRDQYDRIMMEYSRRQDEHQRLQSRRRSHVCARIPEYRQLEEQAADLSAAELDARLFEGKTNPELSGRLHDLTAKKKSLLVKEGYPADYLDLTYECPLCKDTGYVDGRKCSCFLRQERRILYRQSRLEDLLPANNFGCLSEEFYHGADLDRFRSAEESCRSFLQNFDSDYENLFFYGTVGTGKSFLSISIAGELLQKGHSVLYFSSAGLFETISSYVFQADQKAEHARFLEDLYGSDLIVIDDLGTEVTNNFVAAQLFALITERDLGRKSTIISTNLSLPELRDRYSDRIFSRITSNYIVRKLTGPDIRVAKRINKR